VNDIKSVEMLADSLANRTVCPIFSVSNVSGDGIPILKTFFSKLPSYNV
jgi:GTPase